VGNSPANAVSTGVASALAATTTVLAVTLRRAPSRSTADAVKRSDALTRKSAGTVSSVDDTNGALDALAGAVRFWLSTSVRPLSRRNVAPSICSENRSAIVSDESSAGGGASLAEMRKSPAWPSARRRIVPVRPPAP
jgi:hypothetical protein